MQRKIPPERHHEVLARAGLGETSEQIARWLETVGLTVSDRAVRRLLAKTKQFRADAVQAAVREKLAPVATTDLDELGAIADRLAGYERQAAEAGEWETAIRAAKAHADVRDKRLHYTGLDAPDAAQAPAVTAIVVLPPVEE